MSARLASGTSGGGDLQVTAADRGSPAARSGVAEGPPGTLQNRLGPRVRHQDIAKCEGREFFPTIAANLHPLPNADAV